ncbi:TetR/AcrR family transcriptional regulator [Aequorivita todarodis]|uniref:TetR/AcrR family transcriptional regulator n=1 Tax=Aequorivita todarodis TaxID=2036821 RepID=UPI002350220A|nr:TetR/AcrR family transcriptional regulator [Aequorivita todarodis]MDC8000912.1 TetR/AcrR family transcriptional regulator [Aequorivita todarodis]
MPKTTTFTKEKVLAQAISCFYKKGYHGTSMQDLVDTTELNRSSIYNSFGSKMDLYQAALRFHQKQRFAVLQKILMKAGNPREALQFIFNEIITQIVESNDDKGPFEINCLSEMATQNKAVKQLLLQSQEHQLNFFENVIKEGQKRGLINERQTAVEYGHLIFSAYQGIQVMGILIKDKHILEITAQNTLRTLM